MGVLVGLALADSTSIGTLVIPVWLLLRDRLNVRQTLLYLVVIAVFYWAASLVLLALVTQTGPLVKHIHLDRSWSWAQLAAGVAVLALGVWADRRGPAEGRYSRAQRWRDRALQFDRTRAVIGLALAAGVLEAATMLPLLAALGMIERSTLSPVESTLAASGYVAIMMLPATVLLAVRAGIGERGARPLASVGRWLERHTSAVTATVLIVLGALVSADAAIRLDLIS
jgi:cytochrome c biogenesis protein CcdA